MTHTNSAGAWPSAAGRLLEPLVFEVAGDELALETQAAPEVRSIAAGAAGAAGVAAAEPVQVIDLRARLGCAPSGRAQRLVVVYAGGRPIGLLVDRICEVLRLSAEMVAPPPAAAGVDCRLLAGAVRLDDRLVLILSPGALGPERPGSLAA